MPIEPNYYPNSSVFVNKLGIRKSKDLRQAEADYSLILAEEYRNTPPVATFDLDHLRVIHKHLFSPLYTWAGQIRGYNMAKGHCRFADHDQIESWSDRVYGQLAEEHYLRDLSLAEIIERLAYYYDKTNRIHPFPEGNGRTQRLFIEHLAAAAGYQVSWSQAQAWQIIEVATQSFDGNIEPTRFMFENITTPLKAADNWTLTSVPDKP